MSVTISHSPTFAVRGTLAVRVFSRIGQRAACAIHQWGVRARQRRELLMLNDVELRELSLIEADVNREANKPFWQSIHLKG